MIPISGVNTGAVQPGTAAEQTPGPSQAQQPEGDMRNRSMVPLRDEYIPEEKREPSGRYWLGRDGDGRPKVYFDDPERAENTPGKRAADSRTEEVCSGSTDAVDREIEKLKEKQEELERQIDSETDEANIKELEKKLAQVESELRQKDNDTYRRRRTVFS